MGTRLILFFLLPALVAGQGYGFDRVRRDASSQHIDQSDESTHQHRRQRSIGHSTHATHEWLSDVNVEWLDPDQLEAVKSAGDSVSKVHKLRHYYNQLPSAIEKVEAAKKIVGKCYDWLADVTTQAEREALFSLHHHDHNACKVKVGEYMQRLPEPKQTQLEKYWTFCEHVWYDSHTADTTRGLSHDHDGLSGHSSHPGYSPRAGQHHPSHHQHQSPIQEPIPGRRSKRTIDEPQGKTLEDYLQTYLSWLSEEQKEQLREMKTEGKSRRDLQAKIFEFYESATGDTKETATQQLQDGCRTLLRSTIGEERANELKRMRESGTPVEELAKKVDDYLAEVTDEKGKATVAEYGQSCRKILGVTGGASRRRRDHHEGHEGHHEGHHGNHTLEDYFKTHLSWLTDEQKEVLRTLKTEGKSRSELQAKVFEFYDAATGEQKEKATQQMQGGCRELIRSVIGEEKAQELKQMKESGAATADIAKKAEEFLAAVTDEHKKAIVAEYKPSCKKIFGVAVSRRRRDHHLSDEGHHHEEKGIEEQTLEEHLTHHLSWLSDEQKETLRAMKADGKSKREIQQKVLEYYEAASGATKEKATEELQCGCRMLLRSVIGDEKAQELKQMKESGVSMSELSTKADDFLKQVSDEGKKSLVAEYGPACKKLFGLTTSLPSRRRRSSTWEADNNNAVGDGEEGDGGEGAVDDTNGRRADDEFENRLSSQYHWLGDAHKDELRSQRLQGSSDSAIQDKVLEYFHLSSDDVKEVARSLLLNGCERLMVKIFGAEKADALKLMREQGSSAQEMHEKMREYASEIEDEGEKAEVLQHGSSCQKIFEAVPAGTSSTRRRRALRSPLSKREEKPRSTAPESPTHSQCRKILLEVLGEDRVTELKERQLAGASRKWLQIRAHYYLEELRWEGDDRVGQFTDQCREVMGIAPAGHGDNGRKVQKKVGTPWAYVLPVEQDEQ